MVWSKKVVILHFKTAKNAINLFLLRDFISQYENEGLMDKFVAGSRYANKKNMCDMNYEDFIHNFDAITAAIS